MVKDDFQIDQAGSILDLVDCLEEGTYKDGPLILIQYLDSLPQNETFDYLRTLCVPNIFHEFEKNVESKEEPQERFYRFLMSLHGKLKSLVEAENFTALLSGGLERSLANKFDEEIKKHTGQHYGSLFKAFDSKSYFEEAKNLLSDRLTRNGIDLKRFIGKSLLDQGCGGGRYTVAWRNLGVANCVGFDYSEIGLEDARRRCLQSGVTNVDFVHGSVLDMPFEDSTFDIVYSNGVLHHTEGWKKGISEQLRVMKDGGWGWQYLIEKPGGIFWDQIEILRAIMRGVSKPFAQQVLRGLGIPANRVFYMLDHVMVPINTRVTEEELYNELQAHGATDIKRLRRGTDFDRVEAIYRKVPYAREKFGIGENRFVFTKK